MYYDMYYWKKVRWWIGISFSCIQTFVSNDRMPEIFLISIWELTCDFKVFKGGTIKGKIDGSLLDCIYSCTVQYIYLKYIVC